MHFGNRTGRCAAVPVPSYWRDRRVAKDNVSRRARHKTAPRGCCRSFVKRSSAPATATRVGAGVLYSRDVPHHVPDDAPDRLAGKGIGNLSAEATNGLASPLATLGW